MAEKPRKYFGNLGPDEIVGELVTRIDNFYTDIETSGYFSILRKTYRAYYGSSTDNYDTGTMFDGTEVRRTGEQDELHRIKVNEFRNLIQHVLVLATNPRPAMQARATNSDYRSQAQTILADGILEYYMRDKRVERYLKEAAEFALIFATGYLTLEWDASAGEDFMPNPDTGKMGKTGDILFKTKSPLDVITDLFRETRDTNWYIVRDWENKFDLIAKHPDLEEELLEAETKDAAINRFAYSVNASSFPTDDVPVYTFLHKKTPALPEGRMVKFTAEKAVYYDGPLPYRKPYVFRMVPGEFHGSPYGYSQAFDLLALQEGVDSLTSALLTNNLTFATQNIWSRKNNNLNVSQLAGGLNFIESDEKPEPLQMCASPAETYELLSQFKDSMETLAGINSVVRGNPESSLKSGSALALVAAQALQFNSGFQGSFTELVEDVGTGIIELLQDYAKAPRVAQIAGKHNRPFMKEFVGEDVDQINRVTVELGSAVARTVAGRVERANNLLQAGLIKTPEEYIMVEQTGKLEPMIEGQTSQLLLIKAENERLREGEDVAVVATENHFLHIQEHQAVIANPESKQNPEVVQATLAHIQEHLTQWRGMDPGLLQVLGLPPAPPPAMPGMAPAGPAGAAPPPGGNMTQGEMEALQNTPEVLQQAPDQAMPNMPAMPQNPLTGEEAEVPAAAIS